MTTVDPKAEFYIRAKKEYENAVKPFTYELNLLSTQPKPKKFLILLTKFVQIFKKGMKYEYQPDDDETKDNYWNELEKHYSNTHYEMAFISDNSYEKKKNKLKLYFGLLLSNKKLFDTLNEIPVKLGYMYEDPKKKAQQLNQQLQLVSFLKEAQFIILSQTVTQFEKYSEEKKRQEKLKQKLAEIERKKQEQIEEARKKKQEQEKLERQLKAKEEQERIEKENRERILKQKEQQKLNSPNQKLKPEVLDDSINYIPESYHTQYPYENNPQPMPIINEPVIPSYNKQVKKHQKASQILFEDKYKDELKVFSFSLKPEMETRAQKKQFCAECNAPLQQGFYFIGNNQNQCYYTGQWFCNQHIAQERIAIPWKALESFDLRGYPVSKKSYIEIKLYYEKPVIEIKNESPVVKHSKVLYEFLVLKRQIHLMYDSICDLELMEPPLKKKLNYCLKQNLFSLKNLYDIYNGHEGPSLQKECDILSKHFYRCQMCQKRKGYICPKCKNPVKIFAFELKETHGCSNCRKLYHRKCLTNAKCDCQDDD